MAKSAGTVPEAEYQKLSAQEAQMEIMRIRQGLNEAQMGVIKGKVKPAEYKHFEQEEVAKIHKLEEHIGKLMGY